MRSFLVFILLSSLGFAQTYNLNTAVRYALEHSPTLGAESQRNHLAELDFRNRKTAFYPSLDLESHHGIGSAHPGTATDPWMSGLNLKLSENLYDNGTSIIRYKQGRLARELASLNLAKERDSLILELTKQFYEFSRSHQLMDAAKMQRDLLQQQFKTVGNQYRQGLKTKRDFLRFKAQAQRSELDHRLAGNRNAKSSFELRRLMGLPASEKVEFDVLNAENLHLDIPQKEPAIEKTWEYQVAKTYMDLQPFDVDLAKRKYFPELNLTTGAYYRNTNYLNSQNSFSSTGQYGWNILLQLNYNFLDWGLRSREIEKAQANRLIAEHDLKKAALQTHADLQALMRDLGDLNANLIVSKELLSAQQEAYDLIRREYTEGRVEYWDLMTSLTDLLDAKARFLNARYDLASVLAKYRYFEGTLYANYKSD